MVSALDSGTSGLGLSPDQTHCVVFLDKKLYSQSASLHPGVKMGTGELNALDQRATKAFFQYCKNKVNVVVVEPIQGSVEILTVAKCH